MPRKTFEIATFMETANTMLRQPAGSAHARGQIATLIETTLMGAGVYAGFRYLALNELPDGELPGVRMGPNGDVLSYEERFLNTDDSRRQYFFKQK
jgi:hypothetical protein